MHVNDLLAPVDKCNNSWRGRPGDWSESPCCDWPMDHVRPTLPKPQNTDYWTAVQATSNRPPPNDRTEGWARSRPRRVMYNDGRVHHPLRHRRTNTSSRKLCSKPYTPPWSFPTSALAQTRLGQKPHEPLQASHQNRQKKCASAGVETAGHWSPHKTKTTPSIPSNCLRTGTITWPVGTTHLLQGRVFLEDLSDIHHLGAERVALTDGRVHLRGRPGVR